MNYWIRKSIELANSPSYLDKLLEVYPVGTSDVRKLADKTISELKDILEHADNFTLIRKLLNKKEFPTFPIKDPYVAFLRKHNEFIRLNPKTINRLADNIRKMKFKKLIESLEKPIEFNRQIGPLFRNWLSSLKYPFLSESEFVETENISFLAGSDAILKNFANKRLAIKLLKGLDFIARKKDKFIIAEVKFITEIGGHQQTQLENALQILNSTERAGVIRIAVIDGVVWIKSKNKMHLRICQEEEIVLSSLLLKELIEKIT